MEALDACPHHGFDTWFLVSHLYDGISPTMKQLLETMCGGDFLSKNPEEALDFLGYVAEASKGWDELNPREMERMRPQPRTRGGMYSLLEDLDMKAKLLNLARRLEELEMRNHHEVQAVTKTPMPNKPCFTCQSTEHLGEQCPTVPAMREMLVEQANVVGQFKPSTNAPYGNTYNPSWRNHPNLSWKPKTPQYALLAPPRYASTSQPSKPQPTSPVEQAILNLSKVVGNFVEEQKAVNVQVNQRIDTVESTLNKRLDGFQSEIAKKFDHLQYSISRITNQQQVQEKGKFPSQTQPNPREVHEVASASKPTPKLDEVKAVITLRSGKKVDQPVLKLLDADKEDKEEELKRIVIKEDMMKKSMPPPFPQALRSKKKVSNQT